MRKTPVTRILKIAGLITVGILSLTLVCLAILPSLISSNAFQSRIQKHLSISMNRQVSWRTMALGWSHGLEMTGFKLGNGAAPLLKTDVDRLVVVPSIGRGTNGRFGVDLQVRIQNIRAELAPGPSKPPPPPSEKDPLTLLAESIQKIQSLDIALPVDLRVMVEITPVQVTYHAPAPAKQVALHDFSFRFAMPSLATKPVTATVDGQVSVDGRNIGKIHLNANVNDLVTKGEHISLASALFAVDAAVPGTNISLSGGLNQPDGFIARWKVNLPGLLAIAHPFVPASVPAMAGNLDVRLRAKADAGRDLHATLNIDVAGLAAVGGSLMERRVGPLDIQLAQQISTDHLRQRVQFPGGSLTIPGLITAGWSATVDRPTVPERSLKLAVGPLRLDLARTFQVAGPFLPVDSPLKNLAGEVSLRSLLLNLAGPKNNGDLAVADFAIKLPQLDMKQKKGAVAAKEISLLLEKAACPLIARKPTGLTADLLWSIRQLDASGEQPYTLNGARGTFRLTVPNLNLNSTSPRKVAAHATLNQSIDLDNASFKQQLTVQNVHEQLRVMALAAENGDIDVTLPELAVSIAAMQTSQSGKKLAAIPLSASLTASGLHLPADKAKRPTLQHAAADISAGNFLKFGANATLSASSPQTVATTGTMRVDLRPALSYAAPFVPSGMKAEGVVSGVWDIVKPMTETTAAADKHPLRSARANLAQFDKLEVALKLDNISAAIPTAKSTVKVSGLSTKPDLNIVSALKGEAARVKGGIRFSGLSGLPGAAGKLPAQHGAFTFAGELLNWNVLRLNQDFKLDPLGVKQEAELNVSRIDTLLNEKESFSTATLLKRLDANLFATVDGAFSRQLKQLLPGMEISGDLGSSARVDLTAGRDLSLHYALKTDNVDLQLANGTTIEGLHLDIAINRQYSFASAQGEIWTPLSASLVSPASVVTANPGAAEIVNRIRDDLHGDVRGSRTFSIRRVTARTSSEPLVLTSLEGDLLFTPEKAGLGFFQADLMGGTILAHALLDLRPEAPTVSAASSFSNLDVTYLLSRDTGKRGAAQDAEITGEISITAPVTAEQRELFEQLRLAVNVRKIGANMIERALFSLDPYERNEQVVAQRKMLKLGNLKGLRANAVDGAFSMEGEALIKGTVVELPKVERMRISELPLRQELVKNREGITALRGILDLLRADTLVVGSKGELSLKRRSYAQ